MKKSNERRQILAGLQQHTGWWHDLASACRAPHADRTGCWLLRLMETLPRTKNEQLARVVDHGLAAGFTLQRHVLHVPWQAQRAWLGERLVWIQTRDAAESHRWNSLVSSHLGRYGRWRPDWPLWLEAACLKMAAEDQVLMWVPGTTLAPLLKPVLSDLPVPVLRVRLPPASARSSNTQTGLAAWLADHLADCLAGASVSGCAAISPGIDDKCEGNWSTPLQDRIAMSWARCVYAFSIRPGGNIDQLLQQRLADPSWPSGTVAIRCSQIANQPKNNGRLSKRMGSCPGGISNTLPSWLAQGAVEWQLPSMAKRIPSKSCVTRIALAEARSNSKKVGDESVRAPSYGSRLPVIQPTWPAQLQRHMRWHTGVPPYLVHCVRGWGGKLPAALADNRIVSAWRDGWWYEETPMENLLRILASGCLQASTRWNRTDQASVSFSAVPLLELVSRRRYQTHLGRWDWEPYGVLIERQWLEAHGARPVIYGDEELYRRLSDEQRAYYQPAQRRSGMGHDHWHQEREWRCLGDVALADAPADKVRLFVRADQEAAAVARYSPWPVMWVLPGDSAPPPASSKQRRCNLIQTSRN